jgi:hypothetical protein
MGGYVRQRCPLSTTGHIRWPPFCGRRRPNIGATIGHPQQREPAIWVWLWLEQRLKRSRLDSMFGRNVQMDGKMTIMKARSSMKHLQTMRLMFPLLLTRQKTFQAPDDNRKDYDGPQNSCRPKSVSTFYSPEDNSIKILIKKYFYSILLGEFLCDAMQITGDLRRKVSYLF